MKRYSLVGFLVLCAAAAAAQPRLSLNERVTLETREITSLAFSGDERYLAAGTVEGAIFLLDIESASILRKLLCHDKEVSALVFDSKNERLLSGSLDRKIAIWDVTTGERQHVIEENKLAVTGLALSADDKMLVACGRGKDVFCWDLPSGHFRGTLSGHRKDVLLVVFKQPGDQLLSVGEDRKMYFWDLGLMQSKRVGEIAVQTMKNSGFDVTAATCSDDRQIIAVAVQEQALDKGGRGMRFERSIVYFDWETGSRLKVITGNQKTMDAIRLTPQSMYVISDNSSLQNAQLSIWDVEAGVIETNHRLDHSISGFELSPRGRWLASAATLSEIPGESQVTLWTSSGISGPEEIDWSPDILRHVITLSDSLPILQSGPPRSLAVLYFDHNNVEESVARSASIILETMLFPSPNIRLLERVQIDKILDELNLQKSGLAVPAAIEIGKLIEAELILLGSVDKLDRDLHITARLIDVSSGQIIGIREVACTNASLSNISDMAHRVRLPGKNF